jgi:CxxC-x17-CxxC domain-containing protein
MSDKTLVCRDCSENFVFTESEQEFFREKGFENEPQRCPACRAAKKQQSRGGGRGRFGGGAQREMHPAVCAECGKETTVPFKPTGDKPVYCKDCFQPKSR